MRDFLQRNKKNAFWMIIWILGLGIGFGLFCFIFALVSKPDDDIYFEYYKVEVSLDNMIFKLDSLDNSGLDGMKIDSLLPTSHFYGGYSISKRIKYREDSVTARFDIAEIDSTTIVLRLKGYLKIDHDGGKTWHTLNTSDMGFIGSSRFRSDFEKEIMQKGNLSYKNRTIFIFRLFPGIHWTRKYFYPTPD